MLYSGILVNNTLILDLHAEQVFFNQSEIGIVENTIFNTKMLTSRCLGFVKESVSHISFSTFDSVIIDLSLLTNAHNQHKVFTELIHSFVEKYKDVVIVNINPIIYNDLRIEELKKFGGVFVKEGFKHYYIGNINNLSNFNVLNFEELPLLYYRELFIDKLKKLYLKDTSLIRVSDSSEIYLEKYIDIKEFINDKPFSSYGIYLLTKLAQIQGLLPKFEKGEDEIILFFKSLNGSYISSLISDLSGCNLAYIDHLGPINSVYKTKLDARLIVGKKYVIISDVICLRTETKISESIIKYENAECIGNITIVKIDSVDISNKHNDCFLFELNKVNNETIGYSIETNFCKQNIKNL